ncbi:MAG: hypothetical protein JNL90_01975 [Planctomycetes bacterium]|nr:hypothetical protein [Planctomycetota bacterium]
MRLSWFAQLFGKKKPATASAAAPASSGSAARYRNDLGRGDAARGEGNAVSLKAPPGGTSRPLRSLPIDPQPLGTTSEPVEIVPRRLAPLATAGSEASASSAGVASSSASPNVAASSDSPSSASPALAASTPSLPATRPSRDRDEEVVRATKMAPQEELTLKVSEGLKNLSTLLTSIDDKMGQQHRATELVAERLQALPRVLEGLVEAERMNLETMRDLRGSMEKQSAAAAAATQKLEQLPTLVDGIGARIEKQTEASASVKTSVESVGQSVRGLVDGAQRTQNSLITEFRRGQDEHRQRFEELVERQRKTILIVAAIGAFVVIALFIVLARLPK